MKPAAAHRSGESGFTLVEIMIALGLTALLALAIASLFYSAGKQQTRIEARSNIFEFQQKLLMDIRTRPLPSPSP